jgi:hypothetical protein
MCIGMNRKSAKHVRAGSTDRTVRTCADWMVTEKLTNDDAERAVRKFCLFSYSVSRLPGIGGISGRRGGYKWEHLCGLG